MKAIQLLHGNLTPGEIAQPLPQAGEVLIKVRAAGVTPTELLWYPTTHAKDGTPRTGAVPCHEFSGDIAGLGPGTEQVAIGDQVYGMNDWFADGALAEYCISRPEWIAPKPKTLDWVEAASVPIAALTAWQGLLDRAKVRPGEQVLVHGGSGAVGLFAVQLAHRRGARVTATASEGNLDFVRTFGADQVIDYKGVPFEQVVHDADVVFDTVGGETLRRSWAVLRSGGRMVTIAAGSETETDERTRQAFFIVEPDRRQLIEVGRLLEAGTLRAVVDSRVPFAKAIETFAGTAKRHKRGKSVVALHSQFSTALKV